jgi:hypothetical protein
MVDAEVSYCREINKMTGRQEVEPRRSRDQVDINAGWPPRILNSTAVHGGLIIASTRYCTVEDRRQLLQKALADADVAEFLTGRWEVLGCHIVAERATQRVMQNRAKVYIFNYTDNFLVEVCVEDSGVVSIEKREAYEHPAAPIEMAQAISIARADPSLRESVSELDGHAILQVQTNPHLPSFQHRCIYVTFTDRDAESSELRQRYFAMVDLRTQCVIASGAGCCEPDVKTEGSATAE